MSEPGWYPDPSGDGRLRYFDGAAWTEQVRTPEPPAPQEAPQPAPSQAWASTSPAQAPPTGARATQAPVAPVPVGETESKATAQTKEKYDFDVEGGGWLLFAGTMLGIAGLIRIVDGLWAFSYEGELPLQGGLLGTDLTTYAVLFVAVGVIYLLSSFLVIVRSPVGRWVGIAAATIGTLGAMTWMPYYPIWSLTHILVAVLVLYALARYGSRPEQ